VSEIYEAAKETWPLGEPTPEHVLSMVTDGRVRIEHDCPACKTRFLHVSYTRDRPPTKNWLFFRLCWTCERDKVWEIPEGEEVTSNNAQKTEDL
jgi:hypothetical protein